MHAGAGRLGLRLVHPRLWSRARDGRAGSRDSRLSYGAVELRWDAPPSCPDAAWIDAKIQADLATQPDRRDHLAILIDDEVTATTDGRFALSSRTTSATGSEQRRWVADACTTLAEIASTLGDDELVDVWDTRDADCAAFRLACAA